MFQSIFGMLSANDASYYFHRVSKINIFEEKLKTLSDAELQTKTTDFLQRLSAGETLNSILDEAFAVAREASFRVLKLRQFDTQIVGGLVLHEGKIAEMATGEGKTLASILPTYTNALYGKGVHVITVNSYLASRDARCAGRVHEFLGLSVGVVDRNMPHHEKREAYLKDITYITNADLGFDYLKDNLATSLLSIVQRPFHFGILDEADSILIDEAKTPLIIAGNAAKQNTTKYIKADLLAKTLTRGFHYQTDDRTNGIIFTEEGSLEAEKFLKEENLYKASDPWAPYVFNALKAKEFFFKNVHYIVTQKEVVIIDQFTGRAMGGRRWSDGLHQALEVKENVPVRSESNTLASITYQNFFLMYPKLSGMSGTAKSEETELSDIYGLDVVCIPTHKKMLRKDYTNLIYQTEGAKWEAVISECLRIHSYGRPVLVGTTNIKKSELLSSLLKDRGIKHNLLNAKPENVEREAEIVSQAGEIASITIATNMAGRGTDILLGGNASHITKCTLKNVLHSTRSNNEQSCYKLNNSNRLSKFKRNLKQTTYKENELNAYLSIISEPDEVTDHDLLILRAAYFFLLEKTQKKVLKKREKIISLGGLHVIGTELHISKRIDNQLRGRAGRQGDPGSSRFFLSLEDEIFRMFGNDLLKHLLNSLYAEPTAPIETKILSNQLHSIQKKIEDYHYYSRIKTFEYDEILNDQRKTIYFERRKILESIFLKKWIMHYAEQLISNYINEFYKKRDFSLERRTALANQIKNLLKADLCIEQSTFLKENKKSVGAAISKYIRTIYNLRKKYMDLIDDGLMNKIECFFLMKEIDDNWKDHLQNTSLLRENVGWRSYGQKDPLIEYKNESHTLFLSMANKIKRRIVYLVFGSKSNITK
ncbi:preprotein translocase subunit SecA (plastid) [Cryptomonas paramecium]|uniref:Protein translocase subunit SecA n=1 Tax=Cryptomonas paramaecium TaxID=2898 RepID=D2ISD2_9CRYP|nr:preprotein translocase subunit SecA [Cryptomonas paramecium]ACT46824.1 preprotein translocase subunit SecA [Cryptomonas paramecium]